MKNIKRIQRKVKYEVLSIEVLGLDMHGFGKYMDSHFVMTRHTDTVRYDNTHILKEILQNHSGKNATDIDGFKPYRITVCMPVIDYRRGNLTGKTNDRRVRTIATMCKDEMEAYKFVKGLMQTQWDRMFKLNRYRRK